MNNLNNLTTLIGARAAEKLYKKAGENFLLLAEEDLAYIVGSKSAKIIKAATAMTERTKVPSTIRCSQDIYNANLDMITLQYEEFRVIYIGSAYRIIKTAKEFSGGIASVHVDNRKVWNNALLCNAVGIAVVHNHPSGDFTPSQSDISLTKTLVEQAKIMGFVMLDHVIIPSLFSPKGEYYSFADEGKIQ